MPSIVRRTASPPLCAIVHRVARDVGGALGVAGHFLGRRRHRGDRLGGRARSASTAPPTPSRGAPRAPASGAAAASSLIAESLIVVDELAQRLDRVVDRVGDRAGDVLGDGRLHGQVAVGEARQLVEQAQDRLLVALVLPRLLLGRARAARRASAAGHAAPRARAQRSARRRAAATGSASQPSGARRGPLSRLRSGCVQRAPLSAERIARGLHLLELVAEREQRRGLGRCFATVTRSASSLGGVAAPARRSAGDAERVVLLAGRARRRPGP